VLFKTLVEMYKEQGVSANTAIRTHYR